MHFETAAISKWWPTNTQKKVKESNLTVKLSLHNNHLADHVVKVSALRAADPGCNSHFSLDVSGSIHTSDLKIGTPVATLPGTWRYRVSTGTGWPNVSIL